MHLFVIRALSSFGEHVDASLYTVLNMIICLMAAYVSTLIWYVHVLALDVMDAIWDKNMLGFMMIRCHDRYMLRFGKIGAKLYA